MVLTHLHMDHIGGLLGDGVRDRLRPDLRVHLAAAEAEFWAAGADLSQTSCRRGCRTRFDRGQRGEDRLNYRLGRHSSA